MYLKLLDRCKQSNLGVRTLSVKLLLIIPLFIINQVPNLNLKPVEIFKITGDLEFEETLDSSRYFGSASDIDFDFDSEGGSLYTFHLIVLDLIVFKL